MFRPSSAPALPFVLLIVLVAGACGDSESAEKARQEIDEAGEATSKYVGETIERWRDDLESLDEKLADWKAKAEKADGAVREKMRARIRDLEEKRAALADEIDSATGKTGKAWEDVKSGLERGWTELEKGLDEAREEFK